MNKLLNELLEQLKFDGKDYRTESFPSIQDAIEQELAKLKQEPIVWECKVGGLKPLTQRQYEAQTNSIRRYYTRILEQSEKQQPFAYAVETLSQSTKFFLADELDDAEYLYKEYGTSMFGLYIYPITKDLTI